MKILAVKLRAIGDSVIWTAALQSLRQAYPTAEIHILTYRSNAAVFENCPIVAQTHFLSSTDRFELVRQLWALRGQHFDWLLGFHATTSLCRWAWLSGARCTVLHHHSWQKRPRGSLPVPHAGQLENAVLRDHRVLEAMGVKQGPSPTCLWLSEEERRQADVRVSQAVASVGGHNDRPRFLFLPGAGHHLRRYPKDLWLPQVEALSRQGRHQPVVIADRALSAEWDLRAECARRSLPLLDEGDLRQFIANVACGARALANDSGPGHIAVALGVKTMFAFGPGCVGDWHPYNKREHPVFRIAVDCRAQGPRDREQFQFCTVDECGHHRCLRELPIDVTR